jgi:dTDP-glucose 4,6-dehydratase
VFLRYTSRGDVGSLRFLETSVREAVRVEAGDLRDPDAARRAVAGQEMVFHLAALIGIPYSYVHPIEYVQTNVLGTAHLLRGAQHESLERFVHTSTSEVYGTAQYVPIDEAHPLQGQSPYSASKIGADKLAQSFHRAFRMPIVTVRPFNTYGPRQPARAIIPTIISQALFTGVVKLGSLTPTRDFTFVEDTVDGMIRAAESESAIGQEINLGSSKEISIGQLRDRILSLLSSDARLAPDDARIRPPASEVERLVADTSKARTLLGWTPSVGLDQGLSRTIDWIREHRDFYGVDGYHI